VSGLTLPVCQQMQKLGMKTGMSLKKKRYLEWYPEHLFECHSTYLLSNVNLDKNNKEITPGRGPVSVREEIIIGPCETMTKLVQKWLKRLT